MAPSMDSKRLSSLQELLHIDIDAVMLYDAALRIISHPMAEQALMEFRSDHLRHIREINDCIEQLGGERACIEVNAEQCDLHGFTPIEEGMPLEAVFMAMVDGEQITNQTYERILKEEWTPEIRSLIDRNFVDEQRHLLWVLKASRTRMWERDAGERPGV
jgi:rubrerythrin